MISRLAAALLIRPGEGRLMVYLAGLNILLGLGMAIGRSSSDALFFKRYGVEYLPHMLFLTSILLVVVSTAYAALVDRMRPGRLFNLVFLVTCAYLLAVWGTMRSGDSLTAFALYYVGYGVMSEILVMHYSYYALNHFDTLQAKRLFPVASATARLGAVLGGIAMGLGSHVVAPEDAVLAWISTLILALWLVYRHDRGEARPAGTSGQRRRNPMEDIREGMRFARHSRLLQVTALGVFVLMLVVSIQDYVASTILTHHFPDAGSLAAFFGWFFAAANGIVLVVQLFVTNRLLRRFGLEKVNLIFPVSTVFSMGLLSLTGGYWSALLARFNYVGMLPAFRIPAASLFYNAYPSYIQGRARALVYGFMLPAGMALSGLLLMLVPPEAVDSRLAAFGLVLAVVYLWLKSRKNHHYADALLNVLQRQVFSGRTAQLDSPGPLPERVVEALEKLARESGDDESVLAVAELLVEQAPDQAGTFLLRLAPGLNAPGQDRLLKLIGRYRPEGWRAYAHACLQHPDHHLRATALIQLAEAGDPDTAAVISDWLDSEHLRLRALAAGLAIASGEAGQVEAGRKALSDLIDAPADDRQLAAIGVVEQVRCLDRLPRLRELAASPEAPVRLAALHALAILAPLAGEDLTPLLADRVRDVSPMVRAMAVAALPAARDPATRLAWLAASFDDPDRQVRSAAGRPAPAVLPPDPAGCRDALRTYFNDFAMQLCLCQSLALSDMAGWREMLIEITARHIESARDKQIIWLTLTAPRREDRQDFDAVLLGTVLDEEVGKHVGLALDILSLLDERQSIRTVRAALASHDRALRGQAMESLHHQEHAFLLQRLLPLLEGEPDTEMARARLGWAGRSWHDILAWCEREGSQWLANCARALASPDTVRH